MTDRIVAIDFETANASPASICAVGISVYEDGAPEEAYYTLIRPEENVGRFMMRNIQIHGIRPEDVKNAPTWREVYPKVMKYMEGALVCAHNASFDMNCFKASCINCGIPVPYLRYFDTVRLSCNVFPSLSNHRLNTMCDYLGVDLVHHNALSDSYGCLMIAVHSMNLSGIYDPEEMLQAVNVAVKTLGV